MLVAGEDITSRRHFAGHVTAGALLLNREQRYLAIHHKQLEKWLCPGGHLEPHETDPAESALRELIEETGIAPAGIGRDPRWSSMPVEIDHHPSPKTQRRPNRYTLIGVFSTSSRLTGRQASLPSI